MEIHSKHYTVVEFSCSCSSHLSTDNYHKNAQVPFHSKRIPMLIYNKIFKQSKMKEKEEKAGAF